MSVVRFGYLHTHNGPDMDGSSATFEWVSDTSQDGHPEDVPGFWASCDVQPEAGLVGPFETEVEAVLVATDEAAFWSWYSSFAYGDDPMGDHVGRNV